MITWVIERLIDLLGPLNELKKDKRELADVALRAVSSALNETSLYSEEIARGGSRSHEREAQLVHLWSAAAIPVRHVDDQLASVCQHKSEYWLNPDTWNARGAKGVNIELKSVRKKYRALLRSNTSLERARDR
jgi:hypothetical protein